MNCNQARTLLSAYRELKDEEVDTTELDAHVETCASCREMLASYTSMGEQLRSTPVCAPPPEMHAKLMKALADEQLQFLQKSAPGTAKTPEFLKPYMQERAEEMQDQDQIAAFSTAETGPLPIIQARRKRRRSIPLRVNQLGVIGLAAAILMMIMLGGLTSLLMVARNNPTSLTATSNSVSQPTDVAQKVYNTQTVYSDVTSALPDGQNIYYTASGLVANSESWMLMQFNRDTQVSTPLLAAPSSDPLIVLSASNTWLVWLQFAQPQAIPHTGATSTHIPQNRYFPQRTWSVHYLSLIPQPAVTLTDQHQATATPTVTATPQDGKTKTPTRSNTNTASPSPSLALPTDVLLTHGIFDSDTAPDWITTPVQGTRMLGDTLFITFIDQQGISHLQSYLLGQTGKVAQAQEIATAPAGHVLAWPTTDSTGTETYWADEWTTPDGVLHSDVWQRQEEQHLDHSRGYPAETSTYTRQLYLNDGMSFQPQVVDDTLFLLSTSEVRVADQGVVTPNGTPFPASATDISVAFTPRTDPSVYQSPADASVHGTIFMIPLSGLDLADEDTLGTVGQSTGFQAGNGYVIWQDTNGYQMYDVQRQTDVTLGNTLNAAALLVVNGNTTLWLTREKNAPGTNMTMQAFTWPNE